MECPVCCETYTAQKRRNIECSQCAYSACQECYRKYLLNTQQDPHCMQCMHAWNPLFLRERFPVSWLHGDYKNHREQVLLDREKQLIPESQHLVQNYREANDLRGRIKENTQRVTQMKRDIWDLKETIHRDTYRMQRLEWNNYSGTQKKKPPGREFMYPCPQPDCRGYMPASTMQCGVCQAVACKACAVIVTEDEEHVCNDDMKANFEAVKRTTKPCPKCAAPTSKIDGCDQMWCVGCHTAWSWNSGEIVRGVIHNPHYFQYLREHTTGDIPRQPGDVPGGQCRNERVPSGWEVNQRNRAVMHELFPNEGSRLANMREYHRVSEKAADIMAFTRRCLHLQHITLQQRGGEDENADLRLGYLINKLTEDELKVQLQRREKKKMKERDFNDIYDMVVDTGGEILWVYVTGEKSMTETLGEINKIRKYANTHLKHVENRYQMTAQLV